MQHPAIRRIGNNIQERGVGQGYLLGYGRPQGYPGIETLKNNDESGAPFSLVAEDRWTRTDKCFTGGREGVVGMAHPRALLASWPPTYMSIVSGQRSSHCNRACIHTRPRLPSPHAEIEHLGRRFRNLAERPAQSDSLPSGRMMVPERGNRRSNVCQAVPESRTRQLMPVKA